VGLVRRHRATRQEAGLDRNCRHSAESPAADDDNLEAGVGIEPASTALQAARDRCGSRCSPARHAAHHGEGGGRCIATPATKFVTAALPRATGLCARRREPEHWKTAQGTPHRELGQSARSSARTTTPGARPGITGGVSTLTRTWPLCYA